MNLKIFATFMVFLDKLIEVANQQNIKMSCIILFYNEIIRHYRENHIK